MSQHNSKQTGFSAVEVLIILVALGVIGFAGWRFYEAGRDPVAQPSGSVVQQEEAPQVESTEDLQEAEEYLESADIDEELDTSELDAALEQI